MDELESQVAKIQIGNFKNTSNYVYADAEKASGSDDELFVLAELPLLNPAAQDSCEQICLCVTAALRRAYRRGSGESTFENAVAQINDELTKLAEMGQTQWVNKLNCIVAVKSGHGFTLATCGKVSAFLYRNREFTDISCSSNQSHPVKTFENYAAGKLKLDDILILSNTQLFNFLSMDRMRDILDGHNFLTASQTIIEILKENGGPTVAFGTILNKQVRPGQTPEAEVDLEDYDLKPAGAPLLSKLKSFASSLLVMDKLKRTPKIDLPRLKPGASNRNEENETIAGSAAVAAQPAKPSPTQPVQNIPRDNSYTTPTKPTASFAAQLPGIIFSAIKTAGVKLWHFLLSLPTAWRSLRDHLSAGRSMANSLQIKEYSPQKKIFLISVIVLLLAVITEIAVVSNINKTKKQRLTVAGNLQQAQGLTGKAQDAILLNEQQQAQQYLSQAESQLPKENTLSSTDKKTYADLVNEINSLKSKLEKTTEVKTTQISSLGFGGSLISLPGYEAVQAGSNIVSYDTSGGLVQDGALKSSETIVAAVSVSNTTAVVYNGQALLVWDFQKSLYGSAFTQNVPGQNDFGGLAYYPTNSRVYVVNKKTNQIISFLVTGRTISKPTVSNKDAADLTSGQGLAIDSNIYVLTGNGVIKYTSGKLQSFSLPFLYTPFSGSGKIATQKDFQNIYILDSGNNRIIVLDKKGNLVATLVSKDFTKLKDFLVDEKNKVMYVLNDNILLKVTLP